LILYKYSSCPRAFGTFRATSSTHEEIEEL
jgi:hypothetical protein